MECDVVCVRAVVMTRDDSSGGWVPLGGGGLSHVVICKGQSSEAKGRVEYYVRGKRLRDQAPVMEFVVQEGLVYNKVNPIFHHWRVGDRKFGLTFQSTADAISFERGLRSVIGCMDKAERETEEDTACRVDVGRVSSSFQLHAGSDSSCNNRRELLLKPVTIVTSESSSSSSPNALSPTSAGFVSGVHTRPLLTQFSPAGSAANLPSIPLPTPTAPSPMAPPAGFPAPLQSLSLLEQMDLKELWGVRGYEDYRRAEVARTAGEWTGSGGGGLPDKPELYTVHFKKERLGAWLGGGEETVVLDSKVTQRFSAGIPVCMSTPGTVSSSATASGCPPDDSRSTPLACCICTSWSWWKRGGASVPSTDCNSAADSHCRAVSSSFTSRCVYCRSVFSTSQNRRGRCHDAPDPALRCLRRWTCVWCAESLLYHCASDPEGDFWEPCSCEELSGCRPHVGCCARWAVLLALSLFVPCMCCYLPLRGCLRCGETYGCCGGKHKAAQ